MPFVTGYMGENHAIALSVALYCKVVTAASPALYLLRQAVAVHHRRDAAPMALHGRMGRKHLPALAICAGAVRTSLVNVAFALAMVILPAVMQFMPDRSVESGSGS